MAFTEDLDLFFDTNDFAVSGVINTSPAITVNGILNTPTETVSIYEGGIEAGAPFFRCKTSDVTSVTRGKTLTVGSTVYTIERISHDGTGVSDLILKD